jgi:hypothetical protein
MSDPVNLGEPKASENQSPPPVQAKADTGPGVPPIEARRLGKIPGLDGVLRCSKGCWPRPVDPNVSGDGRQ